MHHATGWSMPKAHQLCCSNAADVMTSLQVCALYMQHVRHSMCLYMSSCTAKLLFVLQVDPRFANSLPDAPDGCSAALRSKIAWGVATSAYQVRMQRACHSSYRAASALAANTPRQLLVRVLNSQGQPSRACRKAAAAAAATLAGTS
jgi:hypothetical protein